MTIVVDWDVKQQNNQTKNKPSSSAAGIRATLLCFGSPNGLGQSLKASQSVTARHTDVAWLSWNELNRHGLKIQIKNTVKNCKCSNSALCTLFRFMTKKLLTVLLYNFILWCWQQNRKDIFFHHHHHIHFRALFSWAFRQVFLEGVLSTQNDFEGQQNPYLASFCHSQALHPMISLACQIFSLQPHSACVLLQSSQCCALHVQTISSYWCGAPHLY